MNNTKVLLIALASAKHDTTASGEVQTGTIGTTEPIDIHSSCVAGPCSFRGRQSVNYLHAETFTGLLKAALTTSDYGPADQLAQRTRLSSFAAKRLVHLPWRAVLDVSAPQRVLSGLLVGALRSVRYLNRPVIERDGSGPVFQFFHFKID